MPTRTRTTLWQPWRWHSGGWPWRGCVQNFDWPDASSPGPSAQGYPHCWLVLPRVSLVLIETDPSVFHQLWMDRTVLAVAPKKDVKGGGGDKKGRGSSPCMLLRTTAAVVVFGPKTNQFRAPVTPTMASGTVSQASDRTLRGGRVTAVRMTRPT